MGRTALSVYRHHPNPTDVDVPTPVCVHLVELGVGGDTSRLVAGFPSHAHPGTPRPWVCAV